MKFVIDTSVISVFSEIDRLNLLFQILHSHEIIIPEQVMSEIFYGYNKQSHFYNKFVSMFEISGDGITSKTSLFAIVNVSHEKIENFSEIHRVGYGESSVLLYCLEDMENRVAILDDNKARITAKKKRIRFTGTIGLLKRGYEICHIEDMKTLNEILNDLSGTGFRSEKWLFDYVRSSEKE